MLTRIVNTFQLNVSEEDLPPAFSRFYTVFNYAALFAFFQHLGFIFLFFLLEIKVLAVLNIVSTLLWVITLLLHGKGLHRMPYFLGSMEVIGHVILATVYLGWESGFHYYLLCFAPLVYFSPNLRKAIKIMITIFFFSLYVIINYYHRSATPLITLGPLTRDLLNYTNIAASVFILSFLTHFYSRAAVNAEHSLKEINRRLELLATTDHLTEILNRRSMQVFLDEAKEKYEKNKKPFSLIISDIDDFKNINDQFGHLCGDAVIKNIARVIKDSLREDDRVARWGGEEFLILLPHTNLKEAEKIAQRLKGLIEEESLQFDDCNVSITMTFGVSSYKGDIIECLRRADEALYEGKRKGKNHVSIFL